MHDIFILAQQATTAADQVTKTPYMPLDTIWKHVTTLSWLQAVLTVCFGAVYLMYGWRIFKILVVICFALIGMFMGIELGKEMQYPIWGGLAGFIVFAGISIPLMKWGVSVLGAVSGAIITGGLWYAFELPGKYILAGAAIGFIAGGMISFIVFKVAVMLFTSVGGSILVITGMISLLNQYESIQKPPTTYIRDWFFTHNWFLPVALLFCVITGIIVQNKFIKGSQDWSL
jgi:hypothetical protein